MSKLGIGTNRCLCAGCNRMFSTVANFDSHREGIAQNRRCIDPNTLVRVDGSARYRLKNGIWVGVPKDPEALAKMGYYGYE